MSTHVPHPHARHRPATSRPVLDALQQAFGVIPNLAGGIANSPVLIQGFLGLFQNVHAGTFSEAEIQVLLLTNAVTNRCEWAVAFHTTLGLKEGVAPADVEQIRAGGAAGRCAAGRAVAPGADARSSSTAASTPPRSTASAAAGFEPAQALEAMGVVAASTITNYAAAHDRPPLEAALQPHAWAA